MDLFSTGNVKCSFASGRSKMTKGRSKLTGGGSSISRNNLVDVWEEKRIQ